MKNKILSSVTCGFIALTTQQTLSMYPDYKAIEKHVASTLFTPTSTTIYIKPDAPNEQIKNFVAKEINHQDPIDKTSILTTVDEKKNITAIKFLRTITLKELANRRNKQRQLNLLEALSIEEDAFAEDNRRAKMTSSNPFKLAKL